MYEITCDIEIQYGLFLELSKSYFSINPIAQSHQIVKRAMIQRVVWFIFSKPKILSIGFITLLRYYFCIIVRRTQLIEICGLCLYTQTPSRWNIVLSLQILCKMTETARYLSTYSLKFSSLSVFGRYSRKLFQKSSESFTASAVVVRALGVWIPVWLEISRAFLEELMCKPQFQLTLEIIPS